MGDNIVEKIKAYAAANKSKMFALSNWLKLNVKSFSLMDLMKCLFETANGDLNEVTNMIEHLTDKKKVYGRTQVYNTNNDPKMDIIKDGNGKLVVRGYHPNAPLTPKRQHQQRNTKIFRKSDDQVNKNYQREEEKFVDIGARLRKLFPKASNDELTYYLRGIREYAISHKISPDKVMSGLEKKRYKFNATNRIIPYNSMVEGRVVILDEGMVNELCEDMKMTEYKFNSNIKQFLHDLLIDPVNAQVPYVFQLHGYNRSRLLMNLKREGIVIKNERISDKDENGEPKTATMMVKYSVPKKNFDRKLKRLFIKMFERNLPQRQTEVNEDGEGGAMGGATSCDSSGQFVQPVFPMQRRKTYSEVTEDTTTSSVGDYQYDVPFNGDDETLKRHNGKGGSVSVNMTESLDKYYEIMEDNNYYSVFQMFRDKETPFVNLIDPNMYKKACQEFIEYGQLVRFPTKYVYQWMGIIMRNTVLLEELTALAGHDQYFPMDDFLDYFFGDQYEEENQQKWQEWCQKCGEDDYNAASEYLDQIGFYDWAQLPDGSDAISDYGLKPIINLISQYDENMSPEECLVLVNKILDVYHTRGDLASAFIKGGSKSCYDVSFRQNECKNFSKNKGYMG